MDHYADDLAALTEHLDLKDAIHVGHSNLMDRNFAGFSRLISLQ